MRLKLLTVKPIRIANKGERLIVTMLDEDNGTKNIVVTNMVGQLEMYSKTYDKLDCVEEVQSFLYTLDWSEHG